MSSSPFKTVDEMPGGRGSGVLRYPWDEWMDGNPRSVARSEVPASFRTILYDGASRHGVKVSTRIVDDTLYFQFRKSD